MKQSKLETLMAVSRLKLFRGVMIVLFLYLLLMGLEIPLILKDTLDEDAPASVDRLPFAIDEVGDVAKMEKAGEVLRSFERMYSRQVSNRRTNDYKKVSGLVFDEMPFANGSRDEFSELHKVAALAFAVGKNLWKELDSGKIVVQLENKAENLSESCVHSIMKPGQEFRRHGRTMVIPCGLTLGSQVTVIGKPYWSHPEHDPKIALLREGETSVMVSQFTVELQGLKTVDGEDPPRILHLNPRLKGDFSGRPVIEQNTCYRMQWGAALRCEGWKSDAGEETVDGQVKCEKWTHDDDDDQSQESKSTWWLNRLIGRKTKLTYDWPFPFVEDKLFVLTLRAGLEGFHISVDGRHVSSFPYRTGFSLEDATGLFIKGDVYVHSIFAASLPTSHPSFAPQRHLEMSTKWKAPPLPDKPVHLFIGILSAGNHFAERMALRKSWMQHQLIKSLNVVARFFVALHGRNEVNVELMKEAEFFGDIVIVPYMDNYDLVVLKTVAICEFGINEVAANYIMKCDDDTFVRIDAVTKEVRKIHQDRSLYMGNINYYHRPLRHGKWAVTYEEWPEEEYPPYANGPGYVVSSDIAKYIVSNFERHNLRLFKMEDVSMGMWVENFNKSIATVEYIHSVKFCQFGCIEDYFTAHYQSPKQMICLWDRLNFERKPTCCNMR